MPKRSGIFPKTFEWINTSERQVLLHHSWTTTITDLFHRSRNATIPYATMYHFWTDMGTCVHISVTERSFDGYLSNALRDVWDGSMSTQGLCFAYMGPWPFKWWIRGFLSGDKKVWNFEQHWRPAYCGDRRRKCQVHWWIPRTKTSDTELLCFLWSAPESTVEQIMETPVIWCTIAFIMTSLQWS